MRFVTLACGLAIALTLTLARAAHAARFVVVPSVEPGLIPDDQPFSLEFWLELDPGEEVQAFRVELDYRGALPVEWLLPPDLVGIRLDPPRLVIVRHAPWDLVFHAVGPLTGIHSRLDYLNLSTPVSLESTAWLTEIGFDNRGGTALPVGGVVLQPVDIPPPVFSFPRPLDFEISVGDPTCLAASGGFDPEVPCASLNISHRQRLTFGISIVDASVLDTPEPGARSLVGLALLLIGSGRRLTRPT